MPNETRQTIELFAKSLPATLKNAVESVPLAEIIFDIGRKNGLAIDKIGKLADEVMDFILGTSGPEDFTNKLIGALNTDRNKAAAVAREVNRRIFAAIRDNLKRATTRGELSAAAGAAEVVKAAPPLIETKKGEALEFPSKEAIREIAPVAFPIRPAPPPVEPPAKKPEPLVITPPGMKAGYTGQPKEEILKGVVEIKPRVVEIAPKAPAVFGVQPKTEVALPAPKLPEARIPEKEVRRVEASPKDTGIIPPSQSFGPKPTISELRNALLAKAEAERVSAPPPEKQEPPRPPAGVASREELTREIEKIRNEGNKESAVRGRETIREEQKVASAAREASESEVTPPKIIALPSKPAVPPPLKLPEQKIPKPEAPERYEQDPYRESFE